MFIIRLDSIYSLSKRRLQAKFAWFYGLLAYFTACVGKNAVNQTCCCELACKRLLDNLEMESIYNLSGCADRRGKWKTIYIFVLWVMMMMMILMIFNRIHFINLHLFRWNAFAYDIKFFCFSINKPPEPFGI